MKEFIRLQQPNESKRLWESEDLQNTNLSVCESKKCEKFVLFFMADMSTTQREETPIGHQTHAMSFLKYC